MFPVPHETLQATNLKEVIVKEAEETKKKLKRMIKAERMKCQSNYHIVFSGGESRYSDGIQAG
jgi:hypothetical protein